MDANSNASEIEECINVWKMNIRKEVKRQRLCSSIKLLFLVLALTGAILLLTVIGLEQIGLEPVKIPVWLKLLGLGLSVILMFVGELWPSGTLKALYRDAKAGHRFYPAAALRLINKNYYSDGDLKNELCKIVNSYKHNFDNPNLTYPDKMLDNMLEELCKNILKKI
jgi:hypothetical protein